MSKNQDLMISIITNSLKDGDIPQLVSLFNGKTPAARNIFLNKLGIQVKDDPNSKAEVSFATIASSALHTLTQKLLLHHAGDLIENNTFLRRDDGYGGLLRKLLAEEGKRHPLSSDGAVPDIIVDHFKAVLKQAPQVLNSTIDQINIADVARNISFNVYGNTPVNNSKLMSTLTTKEPLDLSALKVVSARDVGIGCKGVSEVGSKEVLFTERLADSLKTEVIKPKVIEGSTVVVEKSTFSFSTMWGFTKFAFSSMVNKAIAVFWPKEEVPSSHEALTEDLPQLIGAVPDEA